MLALIDFGLITPWIRYALVFYNKESAREFDNLITFLMTKYFEDERKIIDIMRMSGRELVEEEWRQARSRIDRERERRNRQIAAQEAKKLARGQKP